MIEDDNRRINLSKLLSQIRLSDALLIAAVPVVAYLLIFTYYAGYFYVYGIPLQLIDFDLNLAFIVVSTILVLALGVFVWGDIAISFSNMFPGVVAIRLRRVLIITIIAVCILPVLINTPLLRYWVYILLVEFLLIFLLEFLPPIFLHRGKGGYLDRLDYDERERNRHKKEAGTSDTWITPLEKLVNLLGPEIALAVVIFLVVFGLGRYKALSQDSYLFLDSNPENVILYMSTSKVIVVPYDREKNRITSIFKVISLDSVPPLIFYSEDIGPIEIQTEVSPSLLNERVTPTYTPTSTATSTSTPTPKPTITRTIIPSPTKSQ